MAPVRPEGPYPNYFDPDKPIEHEYCGEAGCPSAPHLSSEAEMLVRAQDSQRAAVPEAVKVVQKDIKDELNTVTDELVRLTKMLKKTPIDQLFDFREIKAVLDRLEALVATSPAATKEEKQAYEKDLKKRTAKEFNLRNKAQTRFGRVYYGSTGETIPPILTKEEWDTLKNGIKDAHAADPTPTPNDGRSDDDLYQEMKAEEAMEEKATSEQDWYRKGANKPEWPEAIPSGECIGIQPPEPWPDPSMQPDKPWPRSRSGYKEEERKFQKTVGAVPPHYNVAQYEANQGKISKELKIRKVYQVIAVFSKVIIGTLLIYICLIFLENILAGKPISTYLNRVLTGE